MEKSSAVLNDPLFEGLKALLENEFPKTCPSCGREYPTLDHFLLQTKGVTVGSGIMDYHADDQVPRLTVCRNCVCGSTLATFCSDRRDTSPAGQRRRLRFQGLLELFRSRGIEEDVARAELRAFVRGEPL